MASSRMLKDPDEVRPIIINWRGSLSKSDAITASNWLVNPTGQLVSASASLNQLVTGCLVSAGNVDVEYDVTNRITTQLGLTLEKTIHVRVQNRVG